MSDNRELDFETQMKVHFLWCDKMHEFTRANGRYPAGEDRDKLYDDALNEMGLVSPGHEARKEARRIGKERRARRLRESGGTTENRAWTWIMRHM